MNEEENKNTREEHSRWRFWFLLSFSLLLIITFVYYLPLRFLHQATTSQDDHIEREIPSDHAHNGDTDIHAGQTLPAASLLEALPLRTPKDRIEQLPFIIREDGVKEFRLEASEFRWEYEPGKWIHAWGYNGQIPGPEIRVNEGDKIRVIVKNSLPDATTVHWHGIDVPWQADGVAGVTQEAIQPGEEFMYEFRATPAGTRFYHSHGKSHITSAQQMDMGLSGAFIVESRFPIVDYDREFTLVLDEWNILAGGINPALTHVHGAGEEGAVPDFNTFTINGRIFPHTDILRIEEGERVLVRFINVGTAAFHPMHLHGHAFEVVAYDGFPDPSAPQEQYQRRNTITIHPGETTDILISADNPGPWLLHCHHVHHAAAGMITLLQYKGYDPISSLESGMRAASLVPPPPVKEEEERVRHTGEMPQVEDDHAHEPGVGPHAHDEDISGSGNAWWGLLVASLLLMAGLSGGVYWYINRKDE